MQLRMLAIPTSTWRVSANRKRRHWILRDLAVCCYDGTCRGIDIVLARRQRCANAQLGLLSRTGRVELMWDGLCDRVLS